MRVLTSLLLLATGLGMALPGVWLILLGGSPYYAMAGALIVACALLLWRGSPLSVTPYLLTLLAPLFLVGLGSGSGRRGLDAEAGLSVGRRVLAVAGARLREPGPCGRAVAAGSGHLGRGRGDVAQSHCLGP